MDAKTVIEFAILEMKTKNVMLLILAIMMESFHAGLKLKKKSIKAKSNISKKAGKTRN